MQNQEIIKTGLTQKLDFAAKLNGYQQRTHNELCLVNARMAFTLNTVTSEMGIPPRKMWSEPTNRIYEIRSIMK